MAIQTATTGNLDEVQNIVLAACRFTADHNAPCVNLIEHFTLGKGQKQLTVPRAGQVTAQSLTDGVDMVDEADIGITTTDLTTSEVGLKFIVTDKLIRQFNEDVFKIMGKQGGDGIARKKDEDVIALFDGFSSAQGEFGKPITFTFWAACRAILQTAKAPLPISCVLHPYTVGVLSQSVGRQSVATTAIPHGLTEDLIRDFWSLNIDGVPVFHDGNITTGTGGRGAIGAMFSKEALCIIESLAPNVERERDASRRAWEINMVTDYSVFELMDDYGVEMQYEAIVPSTTD